MGELAAKVKAKYPEAYGDIPDAELETKVMAKYPGVYDHLASGTTTNPIPVTADGPKSVAEEMDQAQGRWTPEMLHNALPSRKTVADFARPLLEGGGAVGGALIGAAGGAAAGLGVGSVPGGVTGGVIGSGLGYASGKKLADFIEGTPAPQYTGNAVL
ncbi:MAG: hypothetical protein WCG75_08580, partial [Armatimonadota bacterium]